MGWGRRGGGEGEERGGSGRGRERRGRLRREERDHGGLPLKVVE